MQYLLIKSITFQSLTKEVYIPAGATIYMDPETMVGYFAGYHFDVKHYEVTALC